MARISIIFMCFITWSSAAWSISCNCEVWVFSPMTGSHLWPATVLKSYKLEEFGTYALKHQFQCRESCLQEFLEDLPVERLTALLLTYSQRLIQQGNLGYNCTGLTTLKYPVRVKAILGKLALGNVEDRVHVVNHEEQCFY